MTDTGVPRLRFLVSTAVLGIIFGFVIVRLYLHGDNERLCLLILLLKGIGLIASWLLVLGTMRVPFFKRFCPTGNRFDCQRVIDSPAGKVFNLIHAADLGVLYFGGSLLVLVFTAFSRDFYFQVVLLGGFNLLTLPYTVFSVMYQAVKVRRWCALCLIVQAIFWMEFWQFYPFLFGNPVIFDVSLGGLTPAILGFGLMLGVWPLLRHLLEKAYIGEAQGD